MAVCATTCEAADRWIRQGEQHDGLGESQCSQNGEGSSPTQSFADNNAHGNPENRSGGDTEDDGGHRTTGLVASRKINSPRTGQSPEYRKSQRRIDKGNRQHPIICRYAASAFDVANTSMMATNGHLPFQLAKVAVRTGPNTTTVTAKSRTRCPATEIETSRSRAISGRIPTIMNSVVRAAKPAADKSRMGSFVDMTRNCDEK
ncbi:hypothetical protein M2315_004557 [Agrobacterium fabrum]|nr:hypothetical protein [Agrobacterium fabrum]